jgi:hypothetical protein
VLSWNKLFHKYICNNIKSTLSVQSGYRDFCRWLNTGRVLPFLFEGKMITQTFHVLLSYHQTSLCMCDDDFLQRRLPHALMEIYKQINWCKSGYKDKYIKRYSTNILPPESDKIKWKFIKKDFQKDVKYGNFRKRTDFNIEITYGIDVQHIKCIFDFVDSIGGI